MSEDDKPKQQQELDEENVPVEELTEPKPVEEVKEVPQLTYSEWKAQQKQNKITFVSREAERPKHLQNFVVLKRDDAKDDELYEFVVEEVQSKRAQKQKVVDTDFKFSKGSSKDSPSGTFRKSRNSQQPAQRKTNVDSGPRQQGIQINNPGEYPALV